MIKNTLQPFNKLALLLIILFSPLLLSGEDIVERIEVTGNVRIPRETILYYLFIKEGRAYDQDYLTQDFKALWATGFFSDIHIKEQQGDRGKVVTIAVEENPFVTGVIFRTEKKLKKAEVSRWLKENGEGIPPFSFCSAFRLQRTRAAIEELLMENGFPSGEVRITTREKGRNTVEILFDIREGERVRVGDIVFDGETGLPEAILCSAMKSNREHAIESWLSGRDIFRKTRLEDDLNHIRRKLKEHGYLNAFVGEPKIEEMTRRTLFLKTQRMKKIVIPIQAGSRYRLGEVRVEGNTVFDSDRLRKVVALEEGDFYSLKSREESEDGIRDIYFNHGYISMQIQPVEILDSENNLVNVTLQIIEGEAACLNRLEIRGNTFVHDRIIRRKVLLREKERFNLRLFDESLKKINQMGIVKLDGEPEMQPLPDDPSQVDIVLRVRELLKSNYSFSAGYNGYGGVFIALDYASINFLGKGEILRLTFESGRKIKDYLFDLSEPYLLDYPINFGLNVYYRDNILPELFNRVANRGQTSAEKRLSS